MKSVNFEFLRPHHPELADLGGFAERYAYSDPAGALVKLRLFGENLIADFFSHYQIPRYPKSNFLELLQELEHHNLVPSVILNKLHALRTQGNRAAHSTSATFAPSSALWLLREAFDLSKWFSLTVHAGENVASLTFAPPPEEDVARGRLQRENKAALRKLADQEVRMQKILEELDRARRKVIAAEQTLEEQKTIFAAANQAVDVLRFDEKSTRNRLIDQLMAQAGWNIGVGDKSTDEVGKEVAIRLGDDSIGRADYVMWDDAGKPLAVVEAKRTARSAESGRTQAKLYADGLQRQFSRRPVIFYTNGFDIYIWDDAKGDIPRRIYGFYSKESLQRCLWKSVHRKDLNTLGPDQTFSLRFYQIEAVTRVCERFERNRRKALIVQATGTGKTRVAIALSELLIRARCVKRVLFLCDRRELRRQANQTFAQLIDSEPRVYVGAATADDRNRTIYLATYPAMMKCYQNFDVGFFDLIIADESHRTIYNRYRDLLLYFDALQVGLTATPRNIITHDTFRLFDCEGNDPTAHFSYRDAIEHVPPYLAHFEVTSHTTKFLREGIRYADMTDAQKEELEDQVDHPESVDYAREKVDKAVFNKDTDRRILRNLMENGMREATGQHIGKTIIFARDHHHAVQMQALFDEMYPQYMKPRKEFCAVIDHYIDRAEQLIDDFKGDGNNDNLAIAISVDMLDTGIDVPEIVNLVFAKPIKSYVKFWQMIGRGTRLCENLFGPGQHKKTFRIFDHWGNFENFGENPIEIPPSIPKSLMQKIFETRLNLAEEALRVQDVAAFETTVELLDQDVRALPDDTIAVREKWRQVRTVLQPGVIRRFDAATVATLRLEIAPLMQWRDLDGHEDAYRLDLLIARLQLSRLKRSGAFDDLRDDLQEQVRQLPINLGQVEARIKIINAVKSRSFWRRLQPVSVHEMAAGDEPFDDPVTGSGPVERLDQVRRELRGIMHCRNKPRAPKANPLHIDVTDVDEQRRREVVRFEGLDLAAYRHRVEDVLNRILDGSPVLQRIRAGKPVDDADIAPLIEEITIRDPNLHIDHLLIHFPNPNNRLDLAIRQIIGLDAEAVHEHFTRFVRKYPRLSSHQMRFLALIQKHIVNYGKLEIGKLYEPPFTQVHIQGVDGVFTDDQQIDDLLELITDINKIAV